MAIFKRNSQVALATLTSANGTARNGTSLAVESFARQALVLECTSAITTSSVVATFKLQGSMDGTTWFDISGASASSAAGTGAPITTTLAIPVPANAHAYALVRGVATLAGASTAGADTTLLTYRFVQPGGLEMVA